ncbi:hypothetical protein [Gordonia soli]|nr:hypothetical protein [Gordonia soli]
MESEFSGCFPDDAEKSLRDLHADRERLVQRARVSPLVLAGFGAAGGVGVASAATTNPGGNYEPPMLGMAALVAVVILGYLVRRVIGVRFRSWGVAAITAAVGVVIVCMALYSVSLGLVASGHHWPVALTSAAAFVVAMAGAAASYRGAIRNLHSA